MHSFFTMLGCREICTDEEVMKNLAGVATCDQEIKTELMRTGIEVVHGERMCREVPASVTGKLGAFTFVRQWYYYSAVGNVPIAVARELYADTVGRKDIRSGGHAGCPSPDEYGSEWQLEDGRKVVPLKEKVIADRLIEKRILNQSHLDQYVFSDDPASQGAKQYVTCYHIDSELGLYKFAEALKRHKLV